MCCFRDFLKVKGKILKALSCTDAKIIRLKIDIAVTVIHRLFLRWCGVRQNFLRCCGVQTPPPPPPQCPPQKRYSCGNIGYARKINIHKNGWAKIPKWYGKATRFDVAGAFFSSRLLIAVTLWNFLLFINYWPILKIYVSTNSDVKPCRWKRSLSKSLWLYQTWRHVLGRMAELRTTDSQALWRTFYLGFKWWRRHVP